MIELIVYIVVIMVLYISGNVREIFNKLNILKQAIIILFFSLFIGGQVIKNSEFTYPFTYWGMYSQVIPNQNYNEYKIILEDGEIVHYPIEQVAFTSQRAFMRKIKLTEERTDRDDDLILLDEAVKGLVALYEQTYPERTVQAFVINSVHITLQPGGPGYTATADERYRKEFLQ